MSKTAWLILVLCLATIHFGMLLYTLVRLAYCGYDNAKYTKYNLLSVVLVLIGPILTIMLTHTDSKKGKLKTKTNQATNISSKPPNIDKSE